MSNFRSMALLDQKPSLNCTWPWDNQRRAAPCPGVLHVALPYMMTSKITMWWYLLGQSLPSTSACQSTMHTKMPCQDLTLYFHWAQVHSPARMDCCTCLEASNVRPLNPSNTSPSFQQKPKHILLDYLAANVANMLATCCNDTMCCSNSGQGGPCCRHRI